MPPTPAAAKDAPAPDYADRLDQIDERLDRLADTIDQIAKLELPSPQALEDLEIRLQAVEERPEPIEYDSERPPGERAKPQPKLCPECGGPENGPHFDDCVTGLGGDALPKTAAEREAAERRERRHA